MSEFLVYGVPGSPFVRSVQMGLEEKGAAYRLHAMSPGESKSEAYLKRHPFGHRLPLFRARPDAGGRRQPRQRHRLRPA
jgi:glutathione S-transferase